MSTPLTRPIVVELTTTEEFAFVTAALATARQTLSDAVLGQPASIVLGAVEMIEVVLDVEQRLLAEGIKYGNEARAAREADILKYN